MRSHAGYRWPVCKQGFTLIEIMVTLAILGLLATMVIPVTQMMAQRQNELALRRNLREIRQAIDGYKQAWDDGRIAKDAVSNGYPATLSVLVNGVPDQRNPKQARIYFLRRVPSDPFCTDDRATAEQCWGKRSYASDPASPREGEDVYDVYSKSEKKGLNDVPYRDW